MSESKTAQDIAVKARTGDVLIEENVDFAGLLLSEQVQNGLSKAGFVRPSPIQLKAIPLGRCGLDLIVQAKSGTGKTCVFTVIALEGMIEKCSSVQVLVLAPTREIAMQIWEVITSIGACMPFLKCCTFIGGTPLTDDKLKLNKCNVAVGTPGRIKQLIETQAMNTDNVRLFVLDEADKLVEDSFQEQINWIYSTLPENKQMLALSATYPEVLAQHLTAYMRNPTFVRLNSSDPALLGIRQYYKLVKYHPLSHKMFDHKTEALIELLSSVEFHQCLVFSNYQLRAQSLSEVLNARGWPATYISGSQEQQHRMAAMASLKQMTCRILISTDLTSRGIDAENVNLVVNLDLPPCHETYLHRIGRAGRFGSYGAAVSLITQGKEMEEFKRLETNCSTNIKKLPDPVPADLTRSSGYVSLDLLVTTETLHTRDDDVVGSAYKKSLNKDGQPEKDSSKSESKDGGKAVDYKSSSVPREQDKNPASQHNGASGNGVKERQKREETNRNGNENGKPLPVQSSGPNESNAPNGRGGGEVKAEEQNAGEKKPKWKMNDVWTKLSYSYGEECKASEARRKMGKEDDRSNDRRRPMATKCPVTTSGSKTTESRVKNGSQGTTASSIDSTCVDKSTPADEKETLEEPCKLPQPDLTSLRGYKANCRDFSQILADYNSCMSDATSTVDTLIKQPSTVLDADVKSKYDEYFTGVGKILTEKEGLMIATPMISISAEPPTSMKENDDNVISLTASEKKSDVRNPSEKNSPPPLGDKPREVDDDKSSLKVKPDDKSSHTRGDDSTEPVLTDENSELSSEMFSLKTQSPKQSLIPPKTSKSNSSKASPQDKNAQIRKYDRRRSPRKVNQLQQRLIASPVGAVIGEGGVSESNTNSYPESESDYTKDHPSDSILSETASSANDVKRRPPRRPQHNTHSHYPQGPWVSQSRGEKGALATDNTGAYPNQFLDKEGEGSSSSDLIESDEDTYSESEGEVSLCSSQESDDIHGPGFECPHFAQGFDPQLAAQYQAMQYASCYHLYSMHKHYADYYKAMCQNIARQMDQSSAFMQQKDYIAKMSKWMAGRKE